IRAGTRVSARVLQPTLSIDKYRLTGEYRTVRTAGSVAGFARTHSLPFLGFRHRLTGSRTQLKAAPGHDGARLACHLLAMGTFEGGAKRARLRGGPRICRPGHFSMPCGAGPRRRWDRSFLGAHRGAPRRADAVP